MVHSLGFSAEGSLFESRPGPSESMKLFSSNKLIPSTQNSTNVDSHELHLQSSGYIGWATHECYVCFCGISYLLFKKKKIFEFWVRKALKTMQIYVMRYFFKTNEFLRFYLKNISKKMSPLHSKWHILHLSIRVKINMIIYEISPLLTSAKCVILNVTDSNNKIQ